MCIVTCIGLFDYNEAAKVTASQPNMICSYSITIHCTLSAPLNTHLPIVYAFFACNGICFITENAEIVNL